MVLGSLSGVFWTLTFQTTLKYVIITLRADNQGEGGIFSLYALVQHFRFLRHAIKMKLGVGGSPPLP